MHERTILYVDDQQSHLALFKKAFEKDYTVITASSGEEGLKVLQDQDVFLVIADHNMPQMTGIDFLERVKDLRPKAIQAMLSAYSNESIVSEAGRRTKIVEFLTKPWKWERVRRFVSEAHQAYEIENPDVEIAPFPESFQEQGALSWKRVVSFLQGLEEEAVDARGAKRIFLNHVEPPLRDYVPAVRRPCPILLSDAQQHALQGNFDKVQEILASYLRQIVLIEKTAPETAAALPAEAH